MKIADLHVVGQGAWGLGHDSLACERGRPMRILIAGRSPWLSMR